VIIDPLGTVLAGPLFNEVGLVHATVDLATIPRARYDFDPVGHYARSDVFHLTVNETPRPGVAFVSDTNG
jgi:nitrilase